jgi:hypothetical protein
MAYDSGAGSGDKNRATEEHMEQLRRRYDALKGSTERANFETHAQEIAELMSPRKLDFVGVRTAGEKRMNRVYDPTGIMGVEMLAAGLHGMATNPAAKWFSLTMVSDRLPGGDGEPVDISDLPEVQKYLSDVEEIIWQRIYSPGTNFTTALHEIYLDLASFATAVLFVGQQENGGLLFEARPLAEILIAENSDGKIDTVFRCTEWTVRQMMQMSNRMGWRLSGPTREKYDQQKYDDKVKVIHAVYPREERNPGQKDAKNMQWDSCYFEHEAMHRLNDESGFAEFPYLVSRWSKYGGEVYGRGPGHTALPDVKMLQAMTLTKIKLMHKAADPPLWLKDDGVVGQTRTVPGGINYWRGNPNDGVMLQPTNLQGIQYIAQDIQQLREQIMRTFNADLMRMTDRANMTATEVVQRTNEMMRLFGPLIGRLESEMLGPLVERVFGILTREGLLPEPPEAIQGQEFTVEFVSPVATAQKQTQAESIMQVLQMLQVFGPDIAAQIAGKNLDVDKLFRFLWDLFNNDPDILQDEEQIEQAKQLEQAQMAMDMGGQGAGIAQQATGALKQLSEAGAVDGGLDINGLIAQAGDELAANPEAQEQLQEVMPEELMGAA